MVKRVTLPFLTILALLSLAISVDAQSWHRHTPRDTVFVPANANGFTFSHNFAPSNLVTIDLNAWGTFSALPGQTPGAGFDAAYFYSDTAWSTPYPLRNPPAWNGTSYNIYLSYATTGLTSDMHPFPFLQLGTVYQSSHLYSAMISAGSGQLVFRLYDRISERPDGYYYTQNLGGLTIAMAQHTAGISVQAMSHDFGMVQVGTQSTWVDSIGSYGVDPLVVDSFWIDGPNASDFAVLSEHGNHFMLPNESTNEFRVVYSPSTPLPASATLHIVGSNAELLNRIPAIALTGAGATATQEFGTTAIDFGLVEVGATARKSVIVSNFGNGPLVFDSIWISPKSMASVFNVVGSFVIAAASPTPVSASLPIDFRPAAMKKYSAWAFFHSTSGQLDSVQLNGEGGMAIITIDMLTLDFGTVRSFGKAVLIDTMRNIGNWTASISPQLNASGFSFTPIDAPFLLNAGASRAFLITFNAGTMTNTTFTATLTFYVDNGTQVVVNLIGREERPSNSLVEPPLSQANEILNPNPARDLVHLRLGLDAADTKIQVFDLLGHTFDVPARSESGGYALNVTALPSGVYEVVVSGKEVRTFRMVVER